MAKPSRVVRVDRVETLVLQLIGAQLVDEADAASFLAQVEQHAPWRVGHFVERGVELRPAIAFEAAEHVAGETFAVQPHHGHRSVALADDQRDMLAGVLRAAEGDDVGVLRARHRELRARRDGEALRVGESGDVGDRAVGLGGRAFRADEKKPAAMSPAAPD